MGGNRRQAHTHTHTRARAHTVRERKEKGVRDEVKRGKGQLYKNKTLQQTKVGIVDGGL